MFVIKRETYFLVSDYYSKFQFVCVIPSPVSSTVVIAKIKSLFTEHGVPQSVISDNGGHFSFDAFRKSVTSGASTTCHQAHTTLSKMASRHVQIGKHTLKKIGPRSDVQMTLLVLRATPINIHPPPAELLCGRRVASNLPVVTRDASGKRCEIRARLDQRQASAKERNDARGVTGLT